jgi:hypothetical protein
MSRTVIPLNRGLYELLVDAARAGEPLSYGDVARLLELSLDYPPHRNEMEQLLGVISRHEVANRRPMLTSIVLRPDEGTPGAGFFRLGQQLGLVAEREDAQAFSARQLKETVDFWQSPMAPSIDQAIGGPTRTAADLLAEEEQLRAEMELMDADRRSSQAPEPDQLGLEEEPAEASAPPQAASAPAPSRGRGRAAGQRRSTLPGPAAAPAFPAEGMRSPEGAPEPAEEWPAEPMPEAPAVAVEPEVALEPEAGPEAEAAPELEPAPEPEAEAAPEAPEPATALEAAPATPLSGNKAVEEAAIRWVMQLERAAGRQPVDRRHDPAFPADIESPPRTIEVKAFGTSARGFDLWLEARQVGAGRSDPNFHLYVVENTRQGDPTLFTLKILSGDLLRKLLTRAKEQRYFTVPWPTKLYDAAPGMESLSEPKP